MSLRTTITLSATGLLLLSLAGAVGMIELTAAQGDSAQELARAFEKVRLAGEMRVALLKAAYSPSQPARERTRAEILAGLEELGDFISTPEGRALQARATSAIEDFLRAAQPAAPGVGGAGATGLPEALSALEDLVSRSERQADVALAQAQRYDRIGDVAGWLLAAGLVLGVLAALLWVWFSAFRPLVATVGAMRRVAHGESASRAPVRGPAELQEVAQQFNAMASALAQQQQRQLAFVAGVAHDLKSPIAALRLAAVSFRRAKEAPTHEELERKAGLIERQTAQLDRLVGDFSDRARIEADALELKRAVVDLREVVRVSVEPFDGASPAHRLSLRLPDAPALAECDHGRIEQILTNLLSNAIKYSPDGGVIEVSVEREGDALRTTVRDHGLGIAPEDLAGLFQPYQRVGAHRQQIAGAGLGLFVSRKIAESHGGQLLVESVPGEGSTFLLVLPAAPPELVSAAGSAR